MQEIRQRGSYHYAFSRYVEPIAHVKPKETVAVYTQDAFESQLTRETGQPSVECEDFSSSPGHASDARGSAFNEDGIAHQHYAGEQDQNDNNPHSVSQYDVACAKVSSH